MYSYFSFTKEKNVEIINSKTALKTEFRASNNIIV